MASLELKILLKKLADITYRDTLDKKQACGLFPDLKHTF